MLDKSETFFTSVGCMDGRVHIPILIFGQDKFDAKYADIVTEPGMDGKLFSEDRNEDLKKSLEFKIRDVSANSHHSKGIIVHGHQDCAANPVDDQTHKKEIRKSAEFIRSFVKELPVIPVFVEKVDEEWVVREL